MKEIHKTTVDWLPYSFTKNQDNVNLIIDKFKVIDVHEENFIPYKSIKNIQETKTVLKCEKYTTIAYVKSYQKVSKLSNIDKLI